MGSDMSRTMGQPHGGRRARLNIESGYAEQYKKASLDDISKCLLRLTRELGRHRMAINSGEFNQVFKDVLVDPMELFSLFDARGKGLVDTLEVFAAAFLFSAGTPAGLDAKLDKLFDLFDFDGSHTINEVETEIMLVCVVRGASRVANMQQPEDVLDSLRKFTANMFHFSKRPLDTGEVTLRNLKDWISEREDVLAYLTGFTEARMIISSLQLVEESVSRGIDMFLHAAAQEEIGDGAVNGSRVGDILRSLVTIGDMEMRAGSGVGATTDADVAAAVGMLTGSSGASGAPGHRVELEVLKEFLRFWVAFSVVDEAGNGSVSVGDLKALLWLAGGTGGDEPPDATVQKTMNDIDEGSEGVITRTKWVRYTAVLNEGTGSLGFDGELMKMFRHYDDDRSGSITATEMSMMVRDSVTDAISDASGSCSLRPGMDAVVEMLVTDISRDLVTAMDTAGSGVLGWTEFKKNQHLVTTRLATLRNFVVSVALQRGTPDSPELRRDGSTEERLTS